MLEDTKKGHIMPPAHTDPEESIGSFKCLEDSGCVPMLFDARVERKRKNLNVSIGTF